MVDPATICATAAKAALLAWDAGCALYQLIHSAKVVDETVRNLAASIMYLSMICDETAKHMKELSSVMDQEEERLFGVIGMLIEECKKMMAKLGKLIAGVRKDQTNFMAQMLRQIKLDFNGRDISSTRSYIDSYVGQLNNCIVIMIHRDVRSVAMQQTTPARSTGGRARTQQGRSQVPSVADCADIFSDHGQATFQSIIDGPSVEAQTTGTSRQPATWQNHTADGWSSAMLLEDAQVQGFATNGTSMDAIIDDPITQTATQALGSGNVHFRKCAFQEAQEHFSTALTEVGRLRERHPDKFVDLVGVEYKLAICALYVQGTEHAEALLQNLFARTSNTKLEAMESCHAGHLLALVYARTDRLTRAASTCEDVYWKTRVTLGNDHSATQESLTLLVLCHEMLHQPPKYSSLLDLVPPSSRERHQYTVKLSVYFPRRRTIQETKIDFLPVSPTHLTWSMDNAYLAWRQSKHDIGIYSTLHGRRPNLTCAARQISAFALSPYGAKVITASPLAGRFSRDHQVLNVYDIRAGKWVQEFKPKQNHSRITGIAFSPDERLVAYADGSRLIETSTFTKEHRLAHRSSSIKLRDQYGSPRFSPDITEIAMPYNQGLAIHSSTSGNVVQILEHGSGDLINGWAYSPDGSLLALGVSMDQIVVFRLTEHREIVDRELFDIPVAQQQDIAFLPDGRLIAARYARSGQIKGLSIYDVRKNMTLVFDDDGSGFHSLTFSADGTYLAAAAGSGTGSYIKTYDVSKILQRL